MILTGWKDIAKYLGCGVRTVQRWEKLGMPVRRPIQGKRSAVVAISKELEAWVKRGSPPDDSAPAKSLTSQSRPFSHRILLADDNEALLVTLAARLAGEGHDVRTARDGFEALAVMREGPPDLLVSDLRMSNMSGFELFSIVRQRFPATAVIAYSDEFVAAGDLTLLCDRHIEKNPKSRFELLKAIRELLSQSPLRTQPAKVALAPAWIPRSSVNGYFVLTCPDCLRSFSVMTRDAILDEDTISKCTHCGFELKYHIDNEVLPIQDDLRDFSRYSHARIGSTPSKVRRSSRPVAIQRSRREKF